MIYPQYPITESFAEYPTNDYLMSVYDRMTALGCYVVPRKAGTKIPLSQYWRKNNRQTATRENVESDLENRADALCIITGELSGRLLVLDFDTAEIEKNGQDAATLYYYFQHLAPNPFVILTPAGGVHMYYRIPAHLELPGNGKCRYDGIDLRGEGGQVVTVGGVNTYTQTAAKKGVPLGHRGIYKFDAIGGYTEIPEISEALYNHLLETPIVEDPEQPTRIIDRERIEVHTGQGLGERIDVTLECLSYALTQWDDTKNYEEWLQLWMSAHHASDGAAAVRDYLLEHPAIYWRDEDDGKQHFIAAWDTHEQREDGYTVASLFWLARSGGWLTKTGYEIPDSRVLKIETDYITDWLDTLPEVPERLLLQSQTGSGKTYAIKSIYDRLGKPRTVIFVPSVKLATELAFTLQNRHGLPVTLYRDNHSAKTRDYQAMAGAEILVTTLQTFATKVHSQGVPMSDYGLVYIEESDQLLSQFARGGGGYYGSHVREYEARFGFQVLRDAMLNAGHVICVDATMTKITYDFAEATKGKQTIAVVRNETVKDKAPVKFIDNIEQAYSLILANLRAGRKVVYVADTRTEVDNVMMFLDMLKHSSKRIAITRTTERNPDVIDFMTDVNKYAAEYDFVAYNSVMASGVSITDVTPDIVIQVCKYLSPRVNLQMLNRYRKQQQVYCLYASNENLYAPSQEAYYENMERRAEYEADILSVPLAARTNDAKLRAYLASLAIADESAQRRSPVELYKAFLRSDGRKVVHNSSVDVSSAVERVLERLKEVKKAQKDEIKKSWRKIAPIDNDRPAPPDMEMIDIARGETHAFIERSLMGAIPENVPDEDIYDVVTQFHNGRHILMAAVNPEIGLQRTVLQLADEAKAYSTLYSNAALLSLMDSVTLLFSDLDEEIEGDVLKDRSGVFMRDFVNKRDVYDTVITRSRQKYRYVFDNNDTQEKRAIAFAKIILAQAGLKLRSRRVSRVGGEAQYGYHIANVDEARAYVNWRSKGALSLDINTALMYAIQERDVLDLYHTLTESEQQDTLKTVVSNKIPLKEAIRLTQEKPAW